jgi:hypothetical protein
MKKLKYEFAQREWTERKRRAPNFSACAYL